MRTAGSNRLRGELAGNELRTRKEYVSDRDAGFKQPLERCKLLTRWAFEYFDQTGCRGCPSFGTGRDRLFAEHNSHRKRGETDRPRLRSTAPALDPTGNEKKPGPRERPGLSGSM